ncbi:hypothetical protein SAMN05878503_101167 [Cereibacter ovatus]|uniref:Uncharacterized protein n=1 Tax=Cereibacter ovatus TaxID=439529 RepID=A0A285CIV0_9RHOB|nr:hypothetical protein SAMN05878503_101167 [Cereibacter ovatus]
MTISNELLDALRKGCNQPEDFRGDTGSAPLMAGATL